MAERKFPRVKHFLRFSEAKIPLTRQWARERSTYEHLVTVLSEPPESELYQGQVQRVKELVSAIVPDEYKPARNMFESMAPTNPHLLKNFEQQAIFSDHNIPHLTEAAALSVLDVTRRITHTPSFDQAKLEKAQKKAWIVGMLHDAQRGGDVVASIPGIVMIHGWKSAGMTEKLMHALGVEEQLLGDPHSITGISQAIRHHDVDISSNQKNIYLQTIKLVDRATLGRLFESQHDIVRMAAGYLAARRMRRYPCHATEEVDPVYMDNLIEVAGTVDILVKQKLKAAQAKGAVTPEYTYKVTLDMLEELGVFAQAKEEEAEAQVVGAGRRELVV